MLLQDSVRAELKFTSCLYFTDFFYCSKNINNRKLSILIILNVQFCGFKYIHIVVPL